MSVSKNTTKRMLWRIIHTLESKSKEGGGRDDSSVFWAPLKKKPITIRENRRPKLPNLHFDLIPIKTKWGWGHVSFRGRMLPTAWLESKEKLNRKFSLNVPRNWSRRFELCNLVVFTLSIPEIIEKNCRSIQCRTLSAELRMPFCVACNCSKWWLGIWKEDRKCVMS